MLSTSVYAKRASRFWFAVLCGIVSISGPAQAGDFIDDWIQSFADSEIVFERKTSNVPFFPLAYVDLSLYRDSAVRRPDESPLRFDLTSVSQGALLPFLMSPRDILFVGEWFGLSRFGAIDSEANSFDAVSVGLPVGWLRQIDDRWQAAAFVMPLMHRADIEGADWSRETLGGIFGRYVQHDRLWWVYGLYFDVGAGDDIYLPYLGASWELSDELTLSAVLPWPSVLYAPDRDTLWRFGALPSGASWSLNDDQDEILYTLDSWDLGFSIERRAFGNFWFSVGAGVAGLRSLRLEGGDLQGASFDVDDSAYLSIGLYFRPETSS